MAREGWEAALADLGRPSPHWSARRANLLTEGVALPRDAGATIRIGGEVALEITGECNPCHRMDEVAGGLNAALEPDWRGGVICRVLAGGRIALGDEIEVTP